MGRPCGSVVGSSGSATVCRATDFGYVRLCTGLEQFLWGQLRRVHGLLVADIYAVLRQGRQHEFVLPAVVGGYVYSFYTTLPFYVFSATALCQIIAKYLHTRFYFSLAMALPLHKGIILS